MKFRLEAPHVLWDISLDAGTEIGTDTAYPIPDGFPFAPSSAMTPLDGEAKKLMEDYKKSKINAGGNWGGSPEDHIPIRGDQHPIYPQTINRNAQPIIPPPMEHLTKPNDMKPGETERQSPVLTEALRAENERLAALNDEKNAREANYQSHERTKNSPNRPPGVTEEVVGVTKSPPDKGPSPQNPTARPPGQGPAPKPNSAPGQGPAAPKPPSNQVPRNTSGLVPENDDGQFDKPEKEKDK